MVDRMYEAGLVTAKECTLSNSDSLSPTTMVVSNDGATAQGSPSLYGYSGAITVLHSPPTGDMPVPNHPGFSIPAGKGSNGQWLSVPPEPREAESPQVIHPTLGKWVEVGQHTTTTDREELASTRVGDMSLEMKPVDHHCRQKDVELPVKEAELPVTSHTDEISDTGPDKDPTQSADMTESQSISENVHDIKKAEFTALLELRRNSPAPTCHTAKSVEDNACSNYVASTWQANLTTHEPGKTLTYKYSRFSKCHNTQETSRSRLADSHEKKRQRYHTHKSHADKLRTKRRSHANKYSRHSKDKRTHRKKSAQLRDSKQSNVKDNDNYSKNEHISKLKNHRPPFCSSKESLNRQVCFKCLDNKVHLISGNSISAYDGVCRVKVPRSISKRKMIYQVIHCSAKIHLTRLKGYEITHSRRVTRPANPRGLNSGRTSSLNLRKRPVIHPFDEALLLRDDMRSDISDISSIDSDSSYKCKRTRNSQDKRSKSVCATSSHRRDSSGLPRKMYARKSTSWDYKRRMAQEKKLKTLCVTKTSDNSYSISSSARSSKTHNEFTGIFDINFNYHQQHSCDIKDKGTVDMLDYLREESPLDLSGANSRNEWALEDANKATNVLTLKANVTDDYQAACHPTHSSTVDAHALEAGAGYSKTQVICNKSPADKDTQEVKSTLDDIINQVEGEEDKMTLVIDTVISLRDMSSGLAQSLSEDASWHHELANESALVSSHATPLQSTETHEGGINVVPTNADQAVDPALHPLLSQEDRSDTCVSPETIYSATQEGDMQAAQALDLCKRGRPSPTPVSEGTETGPLEEATVPPQYMEVAAEGSPTKEGLCQENSEDTAQDGDVAAEDLPTIRPPKRRRRGTRVASPPKYSTVYSCDQDRLRQEFPRHNWLVDKLRDTQEKATEANAQVHPYACEPLVDDDEDDGRLVIDEGPECVTSSDCKEFATEDPINTDELNGNRTKAEAPLDLTVAQCKPQDTNSTIQDGESLDQTIIQIEQPPINDKCLNDISECPANANQGNSPIKSTEAHINHDSVAVHINPSNTHEKDISSHTSDNSNTVSVKIIPSTRRPDVGGNPIAVSIQQGHLGTPNIQPTDAQAGISPPQSSAETPTYLSPMQAVMPSMLPVVIQNQPCVVAFGGVTTVVCNTVPAVTESNIAPGTGPVVTQAGQEIIVTPAKSFPTVTVSGVKVPCSTVYKEGPESVSHGGLTPTVLTTPTKNPLTPGVSENLTPSQPIQYITLPQRSTAGQVSHVQMAQGILHVTSPGNPQLHHPQTSPGKLPNESLPLGCVIKTPLHESQSHTPAISIPHSSGTQGSLSQNPGFIVDPKPPASSDSPIKNKAQSNNVSDRTVIPNRSIPQNLVLPPRLMQLENDFKAHTRELQELQEQVSVNEKQRDTLLQRRQSKLRSLYVLEMERNRAKEVIKEKINVNPLTNAAPQSSPLNFTPHNSAPMNVGPVPFSGPANMVSVPRVPSSGISGMHTSPLIRMGVTSMPLSVHQAVMQQQQDPATTQAVPRAGVPRMPGSAVPQQPCMCAPGNQNTMHCQTVPNLRAPHGNMNPNVQNRHCIPSEFMRPQGQGHALTNIPQGSAHGPLLPPPHMHPIGPRPTGQLRAPNDLLHNPHLGSECNPIQIYGEPQRHHPPMTNSGSTQKPHPTHSSQGIRHPKFIQPRILRPAHKNHNSLRLRLKLGPHSVPRPAHLRKSVALHGRISKRRPIAYQSMFLPRRKKVEEPPILPKQVRCTHRKPSSAHTRRAGMRPPGLVPARNPCHKSLPRCSCETHESIQPGQVAPRPAEHQCIHTVRPHAPLHHRYPVPQPQQYDQTQHSASHDIGLQRPPLHPSNRLINPMACTTPHQFAANNHGVIGSRGVVPCPPPNSVHSPMLAGPACSNFASQGSAIHRSPNPPYALHNNSPRSPSCCPYPIHNTRPVDLSSGYQLHSPTNVMHPQPMVMGPPQGASPPIRCRAPSPHLSPMNVQPSHPGRPHTNAINAAPSHTPPLNFSRRSPYHQVFSPASSPKIARSVGHNFHSTNTDVQHPHTVISSPSISPGLHIQHHSPLQSPNRNQRIPSDIIVPVAMCNEQMRAQQTPQMHIACPPNVQHQQLSYHIPHTPSDHMSQAPRHPTNNIPLGVIIPGNNQDGVLKHCYPQHPVVQITHDNSFNKNKFKKSGPKTATQYNRVPPPVPITSVPEIIYVDYEEKANEIEKVENNVLQSTPYSVGEGSTKTKPIHDDKSNVKNEEALIDVVDTEGLAGGEIPDNQKTIDTTDASIHRDPDCKDISSANGRSLNQISQDSCKNGAVTDTPLCEEAVSGDTKSHYPPAIENTEQSKVTGKVTNIQLEGSPSGITKSSNVLEQKGKEEGTDYTLIKDSKSSSLLNEDSDCDDKERHGEMEPSEANGSTLLSSSAISNNGMGAVDSPSLVGNSPSDSDTSDTDTTAQSLHTNAYSSSITSPISPMFTAQTDSEIKVIPLSMQITPKSEEPSDKLAKSSTQNHESGADALVSSVTEDILIPNDIVIDKQNRAIKDDLKSGPNCNNYDDSQIGDRSIPDSSSETPHTHRAGAASDSASLCNTQGLENTTNKSIPGEILKTGATVPGLIQPEDKSVISKSKSLPNLAESRNVQTEQQKNHTTTSSLCPPSVSPTEVENVSPRTMLGIEHKNHNDPDHVNTTIVKHNENPNTEACGTTSEYLPSALMTCSKTDSSNCTKSSNAQTNPCHEISAANQPEPKSTIKQDHAQNPLNIIREMNNKPPNQSVKPEIKSICDVKPCTIEIASPQKGMSPNSVIKQTDKPASLRQRPIDIFPARTNTVNTTHPNQAFANAPQLRPTQIPLHLPERKPAIVYQPIPHHSKSVPYSVSSSGHCSNSTGYHPGYPVTPGQPYVTSPAQQKDFATNAHIKAMTGINMPPNVNPYYDAHTGQISIAEHSTKNTVRTTHMPNMAQVSDNRAIQHAHHAEISTHYTMHRHSSPQSQRLPAPQCVISQPQRSPMQQNQQQPLSQLQPQSGLFPIQHQQFPPQSQPLPTQTQQFPTHSQIFHPQTQQVTTQPPHFKCIKGHSHTEVAEQHTAYARNPNAPYVQPNALMPRQSPSGMAHPHQDTVPSSSAMQGSLHANQTTAFIEPYGSHARYQSPAPSRLTRQHPHNLPVHHSGLSSSQNPGSVASTHPRPPGQQQQQHYHTLQPQNDVHTFHSVAGQAPSVHRHGYPGMGQAPGQDTMPIGCRVPRCPTDPSPAPGFPTNMPIGQMHPSGHTARPSGSIPNPPALHNPVPQSSGITNGPPKIIPPRNIVPGAPYPGQPPVHGMVVAPMDVNMHTSSHPGPDYGPQHPGPSHASRHPGGPGHTSHDTGPGHRPQFPINQQTRHPQPQVQYLRHPHTPAQAKPPSNPQMPQHHSPHHHYQQPHQHPHLVRHGVPHLPPTSQYGQPNVHQQMRPPEVGTGAPLPVTSPALPPCNNCARAAAFICAGCQTVWYCSELCQAAAWKTHSSVCHPR